MIIWGSRGKESEVARGQFHCPQCDTPVPYVHKKVARYFTLYFIPLFKTEDLGEYVECGGCRGTFKPAVLQYEPPSAVERAIYAVRAELESGTPVQMAQAKLVNQGLDEATAAKVVEAACAREDLKKCTKCNFEYLSVVKRCSGCSATLY